MAFAFSPSDNQETSWILGPAEPGSHLGTSAREAAVSPDRPQISRALTGLSTTPGRPPDDRRRRGDRADMDDNPKPAYVPDPHLSGQCSGSCVPARRAGSSPRPAKRASSSRKGCFGRPECGSAPASILGASPWPTAPKVASSPREARTPIIRLGPAQAGAKPRELVGHRGPVNAARLPPAGRSACVRRGRRHGPALEPEGRQVPTHVLDTHSGTVLGIAYEPRRPPARLRRWRWRRPTLGHPDRPLAPQVARPPRSDSLSHVRGERWPVPRDRRRDKAIRLWDSDHGRLIREMSGGVQVVHTLTWGGIGQPRLVSAGSDQIVRLWDPETGQEVLAMRGHRGRVRLLRISGQAAPPWRQPRATAPFASGRPLRNRILETESIGWKVTVSDNPNR